MGTETTFSGSIDTLTVHFALMGVAYVGDTISGMMFMNGLIAAYFVRWVMRRIQVEHLLDRQMQAKITGFTTDFVVVASFMAVQAVPIAVTVVVVTALTIGLCFLIGQRYGSDHDFERTMGMYGTTPTGLALVRILDPRMRTTTMATPACAPPRWRRWG